MTTSVPWPTAAGSSPRASRPGWRRSRICAPLSGAAGGLWVATALVGLALGYGVYKVRPPVEHAETQVYITPNPNVNAQDAVLTDVELLQTRSLAELVLHRLGLTENVTKFMSSYVAVSVTDRVLLIVTTAPSSSQAVQRANVIAAAFLQYRASILQTQRQATIEALNSELNTAQQQVATITNQIDVVTQQHTSMSRTDKLVSLHSELAHCERLAHQHGAGGSELRSLLGSDQHARGCRQQEAVRGRGASRRRNSASLRSMP